MIGPAFSAPEPIHRPCCLGRTPGFLTCKRQNLGKQSCRELVLECKTLEPRANQDDFSLPGFARPTDVRPQGFIPARAHFLTTIYLFGVTAH
jgi:hypothetical protein